MAKTEENTQSTSSQSYIQRGFDWSASFLLHLPEFILGKKYVPNYGSKNPPVKGLIKLGHILCRVVAVYFLALVCLGFIGVLSDFIRRGEVNIIYISIILIALAFIDIAFSMRKIAKQK